MKRQLFIAPIVEGHGEVQAVPILLRRVAEEFRDLVDLHLNPALRVKVGSFLKEGGDFQKYVELAARKAKPWPASCILILLDCEDYCPAHLGPILAEQSRACRPDMRTLVILAHREFETWFLASIQSLQGVCGLSSGLESPANPEGIRDAKRWLSQRMQIPYNEPEHQPRMTAKLDFAQASQTHSFQRALTKLRQLFVF